VEGITNNQSKSKTGHIKLLLRGPPLPPHDSTAFFPRTKELTLQTPLQPGPLALNYPTVAHQHTRVLVAVAVQRLLTALVDGFNLLFLAGDVLQTDEKITVQRLSHRVLAQRVKFARFTMGTSDQLWSVLGRFD
jgi:hypothetical protein